jgi:multidrug efflux system membrane fusion protein
MLRTPAGFSLVARPVLTGRFCGVLLVVLITVGMVGCSKKQAAAPEQHAAIVTAAHAIAKDVPVYLDEIGTIASPDNVAIRAQVAGKVVSSHFTEGQEVKKGDLLFKIDGRPFEASLAQAEADLLQAKVSRDLARSEYDRALAVKDARAMSQEEVDQRKNNVAVAEALIKAREASVSTAKLNLEYCTITSPVDGKTGKRLVDPGNIVKENDQTLVSVQSLDPVFADFTINENDLGTVRKYIATRGLDRPNPEQGIEVEVDIPGNSARVNSALGAPTPATEPAKNTAGPRRGQLVFLDNAVQNATGTIQLRAKLKNDDHYFWPGQFVNVRVILTVKKDAVLVPAQAQQVGQQGPFIYVVKDGKADMRPVEPGQRQGDMLVIASGVQAGEQVVVTGQMMLMPGAPVQVAPPPGSAPGQGQPQPKLEKATTRESGAASASATPTR